MFNFLVLFDKTVRSMALALRSLWLRKLRAFLSVLGIVIGTASVISLMAFGEGSMQDAIEDIERQGATNIVVRSIKPADESRGGGVRSSLSPIKYGLTYRDYYHFDKMISTVVRSVPMRIFQEEINQNGQIFKNARVIATTEAYRAINKVEVVEGRFLIDDDENAEDTQDENGDNKSLRNVAVLGADVADKLFPYQSAIGQSIKLNKLQYVIVGVLADRIPTGNAGGSTSAEEFNNDVYIPLRVALGRYGEKFTRRAAGTRLSEEVQIHQVTMTVTHRNAVKETGKAVKDYLETTHKQPANDWAVTIPLDRLQEAERARSRGLGQLAVIAGISLLVGGIGIMNIMLATVTERTREVGIRRALGAKKSDILFQFLIEAVVQTTLGGLLGVIAGMIMVVGVPLMSMYFFGHPLPARVYLFPTVLSVGMSIVVGVFFGLYPAFRAANLHPIEALRHE